MADKGQTVQVGLGIAPLTGLIAPRLWQQTTLFVIANGLYFGARGLGHFTDG